jgi:hypothetical protein
MLARRSRTRTMRSVHKGRRNLPDHSDFEQSQPPDRWTQRCFKKAGADITGSPDTRINC